MFVPTSIVLCVLYTTTQAAISYKPILEKCEVGEYNTSIITNLKLECKKKGDGDESFFIINSSGDLSHPVNLDNAQATAQVYILENGKYVIQPKLKITLGLCGEYNLQSLGAWKEIEKHGNMRGCGILEPGHYHVDDYPPKVKLMDVHLQPGNYQVNVKISLDGAILYEINFFAEIQNL